ncbi:hypothetical protein PUMCH_001166 [Australozyma saopauloensis]|uniref:Chromatin modification-related protein n=1 Tax=Australozyma saopauloensis TaxID=291208 RepID=A0AAX4H6R0_9ASCO|nr:hypothetical protein PUMCH_001166 [[Candida] saopauloensis]
MAQDPSPRPKSQRLVNRIKADQPSQYFLQFKKQARNISSVNELLPGLNDISDAFEAMPLDMVKYFTLMKEIDAKCIKAIPMINRNIGDYIEKLHSTEETFSRDDQMQRLQRLRKHIHEVIPCLEEKMHVSSVAVDIMEKHMYRINNDYKVIIGNNEVPESIRLGPLNHRAMVVDPLAPLDASKTAQSQRSESRREAIAAKRANKDGDDEDLLKKRRNKEVTPLETAASSSAVNSGTNGAGSATGGKRRRKETEKAAVAPPTDKKRAAVKPKKEKDDDQGSSNNNSGVEQTYCYCDQVSFGEMVGCDGETCTREWFHLPCIGFKNPPKGKWYCDDCLLKLKRAKKT